MLRVSIYLGAEEFRWRILIGIEGRDVNESIDIVLSNRFSNAFSPFHMNIFEVEIPVLCLARAVQRVDPLLTSSGSPVQ